MPKHVLPDVKSKAESPQFTLLLGGRSVEESAPAAEPPPLALEPRDHHRLADLQARYGLASAREALRFTLDQLAAAQEETAFLRAMEESTQQALEQERAALRDTREELQETIREMWEMNKELHLLYGTQEQPSQERKGRGAAIATFASLPPEEARAVRVRVYQRSTVMQACCVRSREILVRLQRRHAALLARHSATSRGLPLSLSS